MQGQLLQRPARLQVEGPQAQVLELTSNSAPERLGKRLPETELVFCNHR